MSDVYTLACVICNYGPCTYSQVEYELIISCWVYAFLSWFAGSNDLWLASHLSLSWVEMQKMSWVAVVCGQVKWLKIDEASETPIWCSTVHTVMDV